MADRDPRVIGTRIARRRHQLGWTQIELAERLGVSPSTVANWERGASYPKKKFGKVEQVLGISLDGEPDPGLPTAAEMERLRQHVRDVLGDKAAPVEAVIDREFGGPPPPRHSGGGIADLSARRPAAG